MRLNQVDLNLFLVFDAIYTQRNLTKAAAVLCITQPAVSNALSRLRNTFDDPLFVRTASGMMPTPLAKNSISDVRQALLLLTNSVQAQSVFDPSSCDRQINCSMIDFCESLILPQAIKELQQQAPNITFNSYYVPRTNVVKELAAGTLDFSFDIPLIVDKNLRSMPLTCDDYVCAVRHGHPLIKSTLSLSQFLGLEHIQVSNRRRGGDMIDIALRESGQQRKTKVRVKHHMAASQVVENSDLLWTLPRRFAQQFNLNILPLPFALAPIEMHLFWHASADNDPTNRWLRELFNRIVQEK